ncbi:MAG: CaiB/BaiF CoA-transferase family protein [Kofleriaceae bacterium]
MTAAAAPLAAALAGVRVLDLTRLLPGPFLTMLLADLGAEVVKVEDPRVGDYLRSIPPRQGDLSGRYLAINRGKRSLALDLKTEAGRAAFLRMVAQADVVVESFRPGVMARLGLGWDALRAANPRLILCSISGYGQTGPYAERAGHDLNYVSLAGVLAMGGDAGGAPAMPGVQVADLAGGALWAATGVLAALHGRHASGVGVHLDISMTEGALALLATELATVDGDGGPTRGTGTLNGGLACYAIYRTADDRYVSVAGLEPKFWIEVGRAIGRPAQMAELVADGAAQAQLRAEIAAIIASKPLAQWREIFARFDCCCEPVLEPHELAAHPLHVARQVFFTLDGGDLGPVRQVRTPLGVPARPTMPPRLGEHTADVLADYGFSPDEIAALRPPG